jgi:type I restriction-modification system DNA methylase subunit
MFQQSVLKSISQDESIVALRWAKFQEFLAKKEFIQSVKEEKYQDGFLKDVFENCLGYTLDSTNPNEFNLEREKKNETDGKKADGAIYLNHDVVGIIELKAQDTKNLDKATDQAFGYLVSNSKAHYVIVSNFDELRFYIDKKTAFEKFSLFNLTYEEFKKLHLLLSFESIKEAIPLKLKEKTTNFEAQISKELYKDFSVFRNHLFENLIKNNPSHEKTDLLRYTQKICDRIIFILFAEDRGLLQPNTIKEIRQRHEQDIFGNPMYQYYKIYFDAINEGNEKLQIPRYNGGLFAKDEVLDSLIIDDDVLNMEAQKLSDYDFASEVGVNILGHIFEQSLTDLEEIQANIDKVDFDKTKSKRKKDGVFYTPEYITKYIVENTLGKMCKEKREELLIGNGVSTPSNPKKLTKKEQQIKDNLLAYKDWLFNLKILDPACGSGAFLNQALEYLISEHTALQNDLALMGDLFAVYQVEESVLEHNLYGVDINEDAVEIAKLSLWLRTAKRGRPLTKLADKIKCGNSLIDDKSVVDNAFVWEEEFKEVFLTESGKHKENGGFDVVIGNPPYVNIANISNEIYREWLKNNYVVSKNKSDLYSFFVEKSVKILKQNRLLGFIISNSWLGTDSFSEFRKFLITETKLQELVKLPNTVFEDAVVVPIIIFLNSQSSKNHEEIRLTNLVNNNFVSMDYTISIEDVIKRHNCTISLDKSIDFRIKIIKLKEIAKFSLGIKTSNDARFILSEKIDDDCYPMLRGRDISRYYNNNPREYIWYKPKFMLEKKGAGVRKLEYFLTDKILIQEISKNINATFDNNNFLVNDTVNVLYQLDNKINFKFILVLLNSRLLKFWYLNTFQSGLHVKINQLEQVPIPKLKNIEQQEPFIQKADLMLELNKKLQEIKQSFYNELSLEKIPKKLQNFEELEFDEFVKEYKKAKKLKFADKLEERNFKNEWKALFENDKKETLEIQSQINQTDKEIDQMVYELYGLSDDEILIVEGV